MADVPLIPSIPSKKLSIKKLIERKEMRQEIEDCVTMVISVITRGAYLIQLDQIRAMFITDDRIRTRLDTIVIEEIEEILDDINIIASDCEISALIDQEDLDKLLDELGGLDVNKAREYGDSTWKLFSKVITDYIIATWKY